MARDQCGQWLSRRVVEHRVTRKKELNVFTKSLLLCLMCLLGCSDLISQNGSPANTEVKQDSVVRVAIDEPHHGLTIRSGLKFKDGESPNGTDVGWSVGIGFDPPTEDFAVLVELDYWQSRTLNLVSSGTASTLRLAILASKRWSVDMYDVTFCLGPGFGWGGPGGKSAVTFDIGLGGFYRVSDFVALGLVIRKQWAGRLSAGGGGFVYHPWLLQVGLRHSF